MPRCLAAVAALLLCVPLLLGADDSKLGPDSQEQPSVPHGKVTKHSWSSKIFSGTVRAYWVYVPVQYDDKKPACVMVFQDGGAYVNNKGQFRVPIVFDNLIHKKEMPVTVGIFINPGTVPAFHLTVARDGSIYATEPNGNAVYRVKDGESRCVTKDVRAPLGVTLWADQGTLVAGDMVGRRLTAFRIDKDGGLSAREQYYTLRQHPDKTGWVPAMVVDSEGRLYAATEEGVRVFDPTGRMSGVLSRPERQPITALAFGGADLDRLYVACGSKLYVRKMKAKGVVVARAKSQ
jgi:hypothetical protein